MQAEPGLTSERRSGMRAATTFRKLPNARPGRSAMAATVTPISEALAVPKEIASQRAKRCMASAGVMVEHERDVQRP